MQSYPSAGFDIGHTNCAISTCQPDGRITEHSIPGSGQQLRSCVYWPEDSEPLVGMPGLRASYKSPQHLYQHAKRRLYYASDEPAYGGRTAKDITARLIAELVAVLNRVEPQIAAAGKKVAAVPAKMTIAQKDMLQQAARQAGIRFDAILYEPVVAARRVLYEKKHRIRAGQHYAVFDWGGGTFDQTVHRVDNDALHTVVGASGDEFLGGSTIDHAIFRYLCEQHKLDFHEAFDEKQALNLAAFNNERDARFALNVYLAAERLKEQLSTCEVARDSIELEDPVPVTLTRPDYLSLTAEIWARLETSVNSLIEGTALKWNDIQQFVAVGGSAMAYGFVEHVAEFVDRPVAEILLSASPSHAIASGCALCGALPEDADRHVPAIGIRMRESRDSSSYTNKMFFGTGHICPAGGETVEHLGQLVDSHGGSVGITLQFVEAKPQVIVPEPNGVPVLLGDKEVTMLRQFCGELELPAGEQEIRVRFSIDSDGVTHFHVVPVAEGYEGLHGTLEAGTDRARIPWIDVMLALDLSSSMRRRGKLQAQNAATHQLLDRLQGKNIRVGIVGFSDNVRSFAPLGTSAAELAKMVDSFAAGGGTAIDAGLRKVREGFHASEHDADRVCVLTSDGHPHSAEAAEQEAAALKQVAELFCVGIGADVDDAWLTRLASSPENYQRVDRVAELPLAFSRICELFLDDDIPGL